MILQLTSMSTCLQNLTHSFFIVCEIITFKVEFFFSSMREADNKVLEAKKTIFWNRYGLKNFIFLFLVELGTCL
jgi:hypothetical protein